MKVFFITIMIVASFGFSFSINNSGVVPWVAPAESDKLINPLFGNPFATAEGKKTFTTICVACHGDKGKGDGVAGMALVPRPGNFTLEKTQSQSDGALFWKMSEGRAPMASYKTTLSENQRWQLVNYLRTFKPAIK